MFRRRAFGSILLARPWGPNGSLKNIDHQKDQAQPTEVSLTRMNLAPFWEGNVRERYKERQNPRSFTVYSTPQDLGELPRDFTLKVLYGHQPCTMEALWEAVKEKEDCPLDSWEHLEALMRFSKEQNWVYTEKNLSNGEWVWSIHQARMGSIKDMLLQDTEKQRAVRGVDEQDQVERSKVEREQLLASKLALIASLQAQLIENVVKIKEEDNELLEQLKGEGGVVNGDGRIDFSFGGWKAGGSKGNASAAQ